MGREGSGSESAAPVLSGCTVVLLEAQILVALDCEAGLIEAGARSVEIVNSAAEALQRMQAGLIDAAIVDIDLGQSAGIAAAQLMVATGVPLIVASAYAPAHTLPSVLAAIPFVAKPYRLQDLIEALSEILLQRNDLQRNEPDGSHEP